MVRGPEIDLVLINWEEFVHSQVRTNKTHFEANRQFIDRNRDVLMNVLSPHKWLSTLESAVFSSGSSLSPFLGGVVDWCLSWLVRLICC